MRRGSLLQNLTKADCSLKKLFKKGLIPVLSFILGESGTCLVISKGWQVRIYMEIDLSDCSLLQLLSLMKALCFLNQIYFWVQP